MPKMRLGRGWCRFCEESTACHWDLTSSEEAHLTRAIYEWVCLECDYPDMESVVEEKDDEQPLY